MQAVVDVANELKQENYHDISRILQRFVFCIKIIMFFFEVPCAFVYSIMRRFAVNKVIWFHYTECRPLFLIFQFFVSHNINGYLQLTIKFKKINKPD